MDAGFGCASSDPAAWPEVTDRASAHGVARGHSHALGHRLRCTASVVLLTGVRVAARATVSEIMRSARAVVSSVEVHADRVGAAVIDLQRTLVNVDAWPVHTFASACLPVWTTAGWIVRLLGAERYTTFDPCFAGVSRSSFNFRMSSAVDAAVAFAQELRDVSVMRAR